MKIMTHKGFWNAFCAPENNINLTECIWIATYNKLEIERKKKSMP